jgi:hypothetical protein
MSSRSVRELGGEIWAEVTMRFRETGRQIDIETKNIIIDLLVAVLARHIGETIENDEEMPVVPLPKTWDKEGHRLR